MRKKEIRLLLAAAMTAVLLSGCGGQKDGDDAASAKPLAEPIPVESSTEESAAAEQEGEPVQTENTVAGSEAEGPAKTQDSAEPAASAASDPTVFGGDQFVGQWSGETADKAYMTIIPTDHFGVYDVVLQWRDTAASFAEWDMTAEYDEGSGSIQYSDGARFYVTLSETGPEERVPEWDGSSGKFFFDGEVLCWEDSKDTDNSGTRFVRVTTYAPSAEVLAEAFFKPLYEIPAGTSGAVLKQAETARALLAFADQNGIWSNDLSELQTNLTAAWAGLSEEEKNAAETSLFSVQSIIVDAAVNWEDNAYLFTDAGIEAEMKELLANRTAMEGFYRLFDTTVSACLANE